MKFEKEDKYLAVSCLQKAIRRGLTDLAIEYTKRLYLVDKSILSYRLSIIAIEDIGIGNINTVQDYLSSEIRTELIKERGGIEYLIKIVTEMCNGNKDRSACEITSTASHMGITSAESLLHLLENPINIANTKDIDIHHKTLLNWMLSGTTKNLKHSQIAIDGNHFDFLKLINNNQIKNICANAIKFQREAHLFALPVCYDNYQSELLTHPTDSKHQVGDISQQILLPNKMISDRDGNSWLSSGIDGHTRQGIISLNTLLQESDKIKQYFNFNHIKESNRLDVLHSYLFRSEGHQVDKRLYYPTAVKALQTQNKNLDLYTGLQFKEMNKIITEEINLLNDIRTQTMLSYVPKPKIKHPK